MLWAWYCVRHTVPKNNAMRIKRIVWWTTFCNCRFGRIVTKVENSADVVQVYNDLFCANCVARLFTIFTLGLTAKFIFWFIITLLPKDWPDIFFNQKGLTINNDRFAQITFFSNKNPFFFWVHGFCYLMKIRLRSLGCLKSSSESLLFCQWPKAN